MPVKVDVGLTGYPLDQVTTRTSELAALGVDGLYCAEGPHDIFVPLTLAAGTGAGLSVTTNAAVALPRNPIHLAHAAYDLQVLSGGKFRLGLAPQVQAHIVRRFGLEWSSPVARMRELVGALRAIFTNWQEGSPLQFQGEYYRHTLMTPMFNPGPTEFGIPPILLGALGPAMTAMTAEVADGLLVLPFNTRRSLTDVTMAAVNVGLRRGGRSRGDIEIVCGAIVGMGESADELAQARDGVRALLGFYGSTPTYRRVLEVEGWGDRQSELATLVRQGEWGALASHVPDDLVDALAICGTPQQCAELVTRKMEDVADRIALFTPVAPTDAQLSEFLSYLKA